MRGWMCKQKQKKPSKMPQRKVKSQTSCMRKYSAQERAGIVVTVMLQALQPANSNRRLLPQQHALMCETLQK